MLPRPPRQQQGQTTTIQAKSLGRVAAWVLVVRMQSVGMIMPLCQLSWHTSGSAARNCKASWRSCRKS